MAHHKMINVKNEINKFATPQSMWSVHNVATHRILNAVN